MIITYIILAVTTGFSLYAMNNEEIKSRYIFNAYAISKYREWWRFFSHGLLHADFTHLLFNMIGLYMFGRLLEPAFKDIFGPGMGTLYYTVLYVGALPLASVYSYFKHKDNRYYNALGASGAVMAIVFATVLLAPRLPMGLMFIPVHIPGFIFAILFLGVSWFLSRRGADNIGHDAHIGGAIFGFVFPILLKPELFELFIFQVRYGSALQ